VIAACSPRNQPRFIARHLTSPDMMWTPRMTPFSPKWDAPDPNQPVTTPAGAANSRLLLAKPLWPPAR
jgi:hypothetical protein